MNILITAGGTTEKIDSVRSITNTGTGRLGALIAAYFAHEKSVEKVYYVCNGRAVRPPGGNDTSKIEVIIADDTAALEQAVSRLCSEVPIHAVIHSMAVSDYRVRTVTTAEDLGAGIAALAETEKLDSGKVAACICASSGLRRGEKISSVLENPVILLEKTPKIIAQLRPQLPDAKIVGFKLLSGVSTEELIDTAYALLVKNDCDYVLANDMNTVSDGEQHTGYLIDRNKNTVTAVGKQRIAEAIVKTIVG
ncbi:MAG: phosphopantothenate--cysteine ligase [Clostridiales Family XIII bacterium]|nr:phosphopantothenate--cysteine ligase [Clostridiales Family XIII bacterium]